MIKENCKVLLVNEPKGYSSMLGELPANVVVLTEPASKPVDLIQVFVTRLQFYVFLASLVEPDYFSVANLS
jgi:hypothetical protein